MPWHSRILHLSLKEEQQRIEDIAWIKEGKLMKHDDNTIAKEMDSLIIDPIEVMTLIEETFPSRAAISNMMRTRSFPYEWNPQGLREEG